ncbi:MAG: TylF/MycF/NovP-related O-methyltransferase [Gaiellaceae bacterium]
MRVVERLRAVSPSLVTRLLQISNNTVLSDEKFMAVYWELIRENRMLLTIREAYNISRYVSETSALGGAIAEVGVYKGGGAKLISRFKTGDTPLHLFDTFEGMPEVDSDVDLYRKGDLSDVDFDDVKSYLSECSNVFFHKGFFPETAKEISGDTPFSFVHLDVDPYASTLSGLDFFFPRLQRGGVLISHDYATISCPGVKMAFDEYFSDKQEDVVHLWDTQCYVKKRG